MENENEARVTGTFLRQTVLALILAPVTWTIVAFLVGAFIAFTQRISTFIRPEDIDFYTAIMAGIFGVLAARAACDRFCERYSHKAIFVMFAVLSLLAVAFELFLVPAHWRPIAVYLQVVVVVITAYMAFWRRDQPDTQ